MLRTIPLVTGRWVIGCKTALKQWLWLVFPADCFIPLKDNHTLAHCSQTGLSKNLTTYWNLHRWAASHIESHCAERITCVFSPLIFLCQLLQAQIKCHSTKNVCSLVTCCHIKVKGQFYCPNSVWTSVMKTHLKHPLCVNNVGLQG